MLMLMLFLKRIKRRASKIYHNFKMTHGYIHVIHEGIGSYKKYCAGANKWCSNNLYLMPHSF